MYMTRDGVEISKEALEKAVQEGRAVIFFGRGNWQTTESVGIYDTAKEADEMADIDTRGECYAMSDEVWAHKATLKEALKGCRC